MIVGATSSALADEYELITSTSDLVAGDQYLFVCEADNAAMGAIGGSTSIGASVSTTISTNTITATSDMNVITLGGETGGWTFYTSKESKYLSWTSGNSLAVNGTVNDNAQKWTISFSGNNAVIANKGTTGRKIQYNKTSPRFACYTSSQTAIQIYKKKAVVTVPPTITFNDGSVRVGQNLDLRTLFESNSAGAVTYSITSGDSYASINGSTLNGVAEGEVTVKAQQAAAGNYNAGEASATITVNAIPTHTVTFSVNGETSTDEVEEGAAIEFPDDPADVNGKTFVGWVAEAINGTTDDAPEFVSSANMGNSDITYYAVFALASGGGSSNVVDVLNRDLTGITGTSYSAWSDKTATSSAVYAGNSAGGNNSIQLRSNGSNSGIVSTTSGGTVAKVVVDWNTNTAEGRQIDIYGKNTAYSSAEELYNANTQGTKLGTISKGQTELTIKDDYAYVGIRSNSGALYLNEVSITWSTGGGVSYSGYCTTVADAVAVTSVSVDATASVNVGETTTLTATVSPDNATNKNVTWASSEESIATVDENGVVTGVSAGEATITVTSVADDTKTATCTVTVTTVAVTGVSVDATASVNVGKTTTLTATVSPDNATNKNVTWASSDESIATVDENGVVTGVAAGKATITVTSVADDTKTATCTVTVSVVPGTLARPYTVAEAIDAIVNEGNVTDVYVAGIVSQVDSYNSTYKSITYWISDDGTTTNQFEVYSGKGIDGANFESIDDIQVGDRVVVNGDIKLYNTTYEFNYNNQLVSRVEKPASDLAKTSDIALDVKNNALTANIADHISSSSDGAYTYESADETVATVSAEGVVTGLKVGSTTITVNQAATLSYKAGSVVINVTVQDTRVAATTIPAINISSLPRDDEGGTIEVVEPEKADDGVTFSFESSDEDVLLIDGTDYIVTGIGTATVTVTATASNSALYKNVTETFEVTVNAAVKSKNVIELAFDSNSTVWGTNLEGIVGGSQGFDGTIDATSSNPKVLTVAVDAEGNVTVTPVAVGSATVTFSAAETASFQAAEDVQEVFTITAPAGITTAPASGEVTETFDFSKNGWSLPTSSSSLSGEYTKDEQTVTISGTGYYYGSKALLLGKSGAYITLPAFSKPVTQIDVVGVEGASGSVKQNIYVDSEAVSTETIGANGITNEYEIDSEYQDAGTIYTLKVTSAHNTQIGSIVVHMNQDPSETVTINKYGYATYCSVNPMDFSETEGYTAWYVSHITSDGVITFNKITGTIKGGQGVLLYNIDADEVNTSNVNVKFASSENELVGNLLVGTTAPTYVEEAGSVYGLSGKSFKKNSAAGTIGANKAYLDANDIPNEVQAFTFVFEDDETGITETRTVTREEVESIFNLAGQRLNRTQKGINIVNGKKVFIKK